MCEVITEASGTKAHFDVEGKFIADLARTRVSEGAWERGLALLTEGFDGMTHDAAISILKGEADLAGRASDDEGIELKPLEPGNKIAMKMAQRLEYLYANTFRQGDTYWKPYAIVSGWNQDDFDFTRTYSGPVHQAGAWRSHRGPLRSLYYADDRREDLVVLVPVPSGDFPTVVLCQKAAMPPIWLRTECTSAVEFLAERLRKGQTWEARGATSSEVTRRPQQDISLSKAKADPLPSTEPDGLEIAEEKSEDANALVAEFVGRVAACQASHELSSLSREFERRLDALPNSDISVYDKADDIRRSIEDKREEGWRAAIAQQAAAHGGWLELTLDSPEGNPFTGQVLRVPHNPFLLWALRGFDFEAHGKERPEWSNVCPMGAKMMMDNPDHSDWMVGAGVSLSDTYSHDETSYASVVTRSAFRLRGELVEEWTGAQFVALARGSRKRIYGVATFPKPNQAVEPGTIAIVPTAGPEYQLAMESACKPDEFGNSGAIICNTGGKLAHLAIVGREFDCTVLMLSNATKRYHDGQYIDIDMEAGTIRGLVL